jgi:plastocyanin
MLASRFAAAAALSLLAGTPADSQPAAQTVILYSHGYAPSVIQLRAGRPVTLTFVNRSGKGHDFTAPSFFATSRILSGRVNAGEVETGPGQSRTVRLIPRAGRYQVHCSHFFHKQLGMRGTIVVT